MGLVRKLAIWMAVWVLSIALWQAAAATEAPPGRAARNPVAEARERTHGLLVLGSETWVNAQRRTREKPEIQTKVEPLKRPAYLKLTRGDPSLKTVALTFDDGPHPDFTPRLLAVLDRYNVKATFFVVGKMAQKYPKLIAQERAAGHEIGNHTYNHVNMARLPDEKVVAEWQECEKTVTAITGVKPRYCRPPGGRYSRESILSASGLGLTTVLWTDNSADYLGLSPQRLERRVLSRVSNGGIILMHDGAQNTLDVLPQIIEKLRSRGYRFVTLSEMQAQVAQMKGRHRA